MQHIQKTLVDFYEVGVRLRQALSLIEANRRASPDYSRVVLLALTLLRIAFGRILAADALAPWRGRVADALEMAGREWETHLAEGEYGGGYAEAVADRVKELELIADACAGLCGQGCAGTAAWLRLGRGAAAGRDAPPECRRRLDDLLAEAGVRRDELLPEAAPYEFHDDCPELTGDYKPWHAVEVGLKRLREAEGADASDRPPRAASAWRQAGGREPPAAFPNGPLGGTLKDLGRAMHPQQGRGDRRHVEREAAKGRVWVRAVSGQYYEVFFKDRGLFEKARGKLGAGAKGRQSDAEGA